MMFPFLLPVYTKKQPAQLLKFKRILLLLQGVLSRALGAVLQRRDAVYHDLEKRAIITRNRSFLGERLHKQKETTDVS
jgi:hypothetical protein